MGEGRIPWTAVNDYAKRYGLLDREFDMLWELLYRADGAYLTWQNTRPKATVGKTPVGGKAEPKRK